MSRQAAEACLHADVPVEFAARIHACTPAAVAWLVSTFPVPVIEDLLQPHRALTDRSASRFQEVHSAAPEEALGWLRTPFNLEEACALQTWQVLPSQATAWWDRQSPMCQHLRLVMLINVAKSLYGLPDEHVAGWIEYAQTHRLVLHPGHSPRQFLGGLTCLFAEAGVSPSEADMLTVQNEADPDALAALVALRSLGQP